MVGYHENIDVSYDEKFENMAGLAWWPWVGKLYGETDVKTFLLGESAYNYKPGDDAVSKRVEKREFLREIHQTHAMGVEDGKKTRYVRNIERAIFQKKKPSANCINTFWTSVVYHNLVLEAMPTKKHRPTYQHYVDGWNKFLELADVLHPGQCIVYGLERAKIKSLIEVCDSKDIKHQYEKLPKRVGRNYPKRVSLDLNYGALRVLFIRHPSQCFSWRSWGVVLAEETQIPSIIGQKKS